MVILAACASWSLITAAARDGRPEGVLLAVLAVTAGYAAGRIGGALLPVGAPCAVALAGGVLAVAIPHLAPGPRLTAPLGHAGATAAEEGLREVEGTGETGGPVGRETEDP
ncbi:hypothetical protein ACWCPU_32570, partial [Streptomyces anthocyanicus]